MGFGSQIGDAMKLIRDDGRRLSGRRPDQLRSVAISASVLSRASGSAFIEWGKNKVIAAVYGPRDPTDDLPPDPDEARINFRYEMAPFSVPDRKRPKRDRRSTEISAILSEALSSVVMLEKYPKSTIDVYATILEAHGGTRCAALTAASVALADAGISMKDLIPACAVGKVGGKIVLDLDKDEDSNGEADMPLAIIPHTGDVVLMQMEGSMDGDELEQALTMGYRGCMEIHDLQRDALLNSYGSGRSIHRKGLSPESVSNIKIINRRNKGGSS